MIYTKPRPHLDPRADDRAILNFLDSLPDSFEIVPEGHVCVKWPDGLTRERLVELAARWMDVSQLARSDALRALAAIAPVEKKEKKMMKMLITLDFGTHKVGPFEHEYEVTE